MADKPMIGTGSMLNSSEGLSMAGINTALIACLQSSDDFRVQIACALGMAAVTSVYIIMRSKAKSA